MAFNWRKFPWTNLHDLNLDWIIQTVKTLENNLADAVSTFREMIDTAISNTLTGSGDLTINKTGDVNITGNNVRITSASPADVIGGAFISATSEQITLHNPNSKKSMTANYNSGALALTNNQDPAAGVAVYLINTPADGGGDNSTFAANVGYVKDAVNTVDSKLDTEISNRTSGDAALRSSINDVIMPLIHALQKRAPRVFYFSTTAEAGTLPADEVSTVKTAILEHTPIIFVADNDIAASRCYYYVLNCFPKPTAENINDGTLVVEFRTLDGLYKAGLTFGGVGSSGTVIFDTISK